MPAPSSGDPADDPEVWTAVQAGDSEAFTTIYHRHIDAVWSYAYRLTGSRTAAEEVLAATFLTAWRRRGEIFFAAGSARPWLLAVAANEARTEWRRSVRYLRLVDRVGPPPDVRDHAESVVSSLDDRRLADQVLEAVQQLPAAQRDAAALCLVGEMPYAEAARELGVSEMALRMRVHRARLRLRALIAEERR